MGMLLLISFVKLLCTEEFCWDNKSEIQSCVSVLTLQFLPSQGWFWFCGFSFCVYNISVFPTEAVLLMNFILLNWNELSWNEIILNEGVSKAAAAWMYCLCFIDSCLWGLVVLTEFCHFHHCEWCHGRALLSWCHSKAVCFFAALWEHDLLIATRVMHLVAFRHLFKKAITALNFQGWTSCPMESSPEITAVAWITGHVCDGMECSELWQRSADELVVHKWRTLPNALCFCFLCVLKCGGLWQLERFWFLQWPLHHWEL